MRAMPDDPPRGPLATVAKLQAIVEDLRTHAANVTTAALALHELSRRVNRADVTISAQARVIADLRAQVATLEAKVDAMIRNGVYVH